MSETFSAELTAIATVALAVLALFTAMFAGLALWKQSGEVRDQAKMLQVQADQLALQQRQFDEDQTARRRAQAAQVFIAHMAAESRPEGEGATLTAQAHNTSRQPVYDLSGRWRTDDGAFGTERVQPLLMPDDSAAFAETWTPPVGISGMSFWLDFRDASGVHWRINDHGILTELCGETSPGIARARCTHSPAHSGPHSWE